MQDMLCCDAVALVVEGGAAAIPWGEATILSDQQPRMRLGRQRLLARSATAPIVGANRNKTHTRNPEYLSITTRPAFASQQDAPLPSNQALARCGTFWLAM